MTTDRPGHRMHIYVPLDLYAATKARAAYERRSMNALAKNALQVYLAVQLAKDPEEAWQEVVAQRRTKKQTA